MPKLLSVNVSLPRDVTWNGKTVRTGREQNPGGEAKMVPQMSALQATQEDKN
jgi:hypothetical protein